MSTQLPWGKQFTAVLLILLLAATLRLSLLGSRSLWFDEAYSARVSKVSQENIWVKEPHRTDSHPPLYYGAMHYWISAGGDSETALRLPSALISIISVALLFLLAQRLFGNEVAFLSALLLAVSPLDIWYAQEARMYIFMPALILLAGLLLTWRSYWAILPLTIVFIIGLYMDYTMPLLWIVLSVLWFLWWWHQDRPRAPFIVWLGASLLALLIYRPWHATFLEWLGRFSKVTFYLEISDATGLPALSAGQYLLIAFIGGLLTIPVLAALMSLLSSPEQRAWIGFLVIVGFLLATLFVVMPRFYSIKRLLVQAWPLVILFVAWLVIHSPQRKKFTYGLVTASLLASLFGLLFIEKDDWRSAVEHVNSNGTAADIAVLEHPWNLMATSYYGLVPVPTPFEEVQASLNDGENQLEGDIWYLVERFPGEEGIIAPQQRWLDSSLPLVDVQRFVRLEVRRYNSSGSG